MCSSQQLAKRFEELTVANPHQARSYDKQEIIDALKARGRFRRYGSRQSGYLPG